MSYVRKIASGQSISSIIEIPEKWKHKTVEILVFPVDEAPPTETSKALRHKSLLGALKNYANPQKIDSEPSAWHQAVEAKHGHC